MLLEEVCSPPPKPQDQIRVHVLIFTKLLSGRPMAGIKDQSEGSEGRPRTVDIAVTDEMPGLSARRGTSQSSPSRWVGPLLRTFLVASLAVIFVGYYRFLTADLSPAPPPAQEIASLPAAVEAGGRIGGPPPALPASSSAAGAEATIGYAITVSGCPKSDGSRGDFGAGITDGAAVLMHSIRLNSARTPGSGSRYDFKMYALVHTEAESCARPALEPLGYEILVRDVPVPLDEIKGDHLRKNVPKNGCCGEKEFVKIHAYTITDHPVVVHLDLDTLVLKPMDNLFDAMIKGPPRDGSSGGIDVAYGDPLRPPTPDGQKDIDAYFTRDYNMNHRGMKHAGVQGGFLVLRPSQKVYDEFVSIIREGDFRSNGGWGGQGFGPFYGSMTFQGIIPYYYDHLHPGTGVELNHCVYNNMADNPRDKPTRNDKVSGNCRDGYNRPDKHDVCEDCRSRPLEEVVTTHFTLCQKPWECLPQDGDRIQERLCRRFHGEWYRIREDLEVSVWGRKAVDCGGGDRKACADERGGKYQPEHFRGYCKSSGKNGYFRIQLPDAAA